jgi:hypothetical protein
MEYVEGETLQTRLVAGPLPLDKTLDYAIDIADALDHAHRRGIIHRDLKPSNIMLTRAGVKLLDLGIAKIRARTASVAGRDPSALDATDTKTLTGDGRLVGSLHYMAPEQLEGHEADARTDVFAFGAVLHEMVTGRQAFDGGSQASVIAAILKSEPPPVTVLQPLTPRTLDHVVTKCLAKDPDDRWQTVRDLATELRWIAETDVGAFAAEPGGVTHRRRDVALITALVVSVLFGLGTTVAYLRREPARPEPLRFLVNPPPGQSLASAGVLSPDGRQLAFATRDAADQTLLRVQSLDSLDARLLPGTEGADQPFWSPDSRFVGFFAQGKLKTIAAASGTVQTLASVGSSPAGATWGFPWDDRLRRFV